MEPAPGRRAAAGEQLSQGLPAVQAIACLGLLLSGEAFGTPTMLPWAIPLFGADRHPTQIYLALAALLCAAMLRILTGEERPAGTLFAAYLGLQGLTLLLLEPLRADSLLLPLGVRAAHVVGFGLLLAALLWLRGQSLPGQGQPSS